MPLAFQEVQRFSQRWVWILLTLIMLALVAAFAYGLAKQLVFGAPWGDRPLSDSTLIIVGVAVTGFSGGMIYLFYSLRLITEVRKDGLYIRFHPLRGKVIPFQRIKSCVSRTYKPLSEYGGWGIKYGRGGWAYNVLGNRGVQLVLDNDKRVLIGSQRAEELEEALKSRCGC